MLQQSAAPKLGAKVHTHVNQTLSLNETMRTISDCITSTPTDFLSFPVFCPTPPRTARRNAACLEIQSSKWWLQAMCSAVLAQTQGCRVKKTNGKLAPKSRLNQTTWKRTVLKFGLENQFNAYNYLSILFAILPLIARSGKSHVTISSIGCAPLTKSYRSLVLTNVGATGFEIRNN